MEGQRSIQTITDVKRGEGPTAERRRHNGGVVSEVIKADNDGNALITQYRARWECPLDVYLERNLITKVQHKTGIRFRGAYFGSILSRSATAGRLRRQNGVTELTMTETLLKKAYKVLPPALKGVVTDVCGHDKMEWNPNALDKLRKGLGHLSLHWNMAALEVCDPVGRE